jgi:fatty acid desaturase
MTVPHYKLPRLHRMLDARGLLDGALVTRGYRAVLERAASKPETGAAATANSTVRVPPF